MTIVLKGNQDVPAAAACRLALLDALLPDTTIVLDLDGVSDASFAFIQVIEAARLQAERVGAKLSLARPVCGALHEALGHAGFFDPPDRPDASFWTHGAVTV
jgi:hypothetical protein